MKDSLGKNTENRIIWAATRSVLEAERFKTKRSGKKSKRRWGLFTRLLKYFIILLKLFKLYKKGLYNAKIVKLNNIDLHYHGLAEAFEAYTILHLSDLHLDTLPGIEDFIARKVRDLTPDLCVITGDYRKDTQGRYRQILKPLQTILNNIQARDGIIGILGNHDSYLMVPHLEGMGIRVLINESHIIQKDGSSLLITGTDDPYYYYTDQAINAFDDTKAGFKIALVHTTELYDVAAENQFNLYLCGHTHGGQICLPGGKPLITHQFEGRQYYKGQWQYKTMKGYTNVGCGVSAIPIRFNCPGEIAVFTLRS